MYCLLTENYVLNANILVFMLMHTDLFSNVSGLGLIHCGLGLGLEKKFGPRPRPRPHSFWPRIPGKKVEKRKPKKAKTRIYSEVSVNNLIYLRVYKVRQKTEPQTHDHNSVNS